MARLTMKELRMLARSPTDIQKTIERIQATLTPDNSSVALCGNCRYNEEIRALCKSTGYPYCQCWTSARREIFVFCPPKDEDCKYSCVHEMLEHLDKMRNQLITCWLESRWYNVRTKWLINQAYDNIQEYDRCLRHFIAETRLSLVVKSPHMGGAPYLLAW